MKRIFVFAFCLMLVLVAAAQAEMGRPRRTPEQIAEKQVEAMQRNLKLTQQQRDTIATVLLRYAAMRAEDEPRELQMERLQKMQEELKELLTAEQYDKYMVYVRDRGPRRQMSQRMMLSDTEQTATIAVYENDSTQTSTPNNE